MTFEKYAYSEGAPLKNPIARITGFSALAVLGIALAGPGRAQTADLILLHGKILTLDERSSVREAMAVSEGRIAAFDGMGDEMLRFNGIGENVAWGMYNNDSPSEALRRAALDAAGSSPADHGRRKNRVSGPLRSIRGGHPALTGLDSVRYVAPVLPGLCRISSFARRAVTGMTGNVSTGRRE